VVKQNRYPQTFLRARSSYILISPGCALLLFRSMRVHFLTEADFIHPTVDDASVADELTMTSHIRAYFHMRPVHVSMSHDPPLNIATLISELNNAIEQFTCRASGYVLSNIARLIIVIVSFRPLNMGGSSYIPTPRRITLKHAIVKEKNLHDNVFQVGRTECPVSHIRACRSPLELCAPRKCYRLLSC